MAPANPELRELVKEMNSSPLAVRFRKEKEEILRAEGDIFPTDIVPVLATNKAGEQRVFPMKWGFKQKNGLLINARTESAAEKPAFSESWQKHRCAIPVSCYYEWEHTGKKKNGMKYMLKTESSDLIWLAGLYRIENLLPCFVILTRPAAEQLAWMHDRMPVILPPNHIHKWIHPNTRPEEVVRECITEVVWQQVT